MTMRTVKVSIKGITPLLQNNPQTVDRFNKFAKLMAQINAKKTRRTDDDYLELRDIEIESKVYFDEQVGGVYVPSSWLLEAIACSSFKVAKVSRADIRGSVFAVEDKIKLNHKGLGKVKAIADIVGNPDFRQMLTLPQSNVRVVKAFPIFHNWAFDTSIEYDDKTLDGDSLTRIIEHASKYGGFGDFRPKFGRAVAEVTHD